MKDNIDNMGNTANNGAPDVPPVGAPLPRVDGPLKVRGAARYTADVALPGMVHAVLVPATIARGQVRSIDDAGARAAPGVIVVIGCLNAPATTRPKFMPSGQSVPVLQGTEVYYHGQPVAVVVAATFEQATHAAGLVVVSYREQAPLSELESQLGAAFQPEKLQTGGPAASQRGDMEDGARTAQVSHRAVYTTPIEHHNAMEPHATVAAWNDGKLTVYESTQGVSNTQQALARIFGIGKDDIRVVSHFLGGGFGSKGQSWPHTAIAALAARKVGKPVKLVLTRPQMFFSNGHRAPTIQAIELATDRQGKLLLTRHDSINHTSMSDNFVETAGSITEFMYSCPNTEVVHRLVKLNVGTPTFTRGPGFSSGSFALESAIDEMAARVGLDPLQFRLLNYAEHDEHEKLPWSSKSLRQCYARGAEQFGWDKRPPAPGARREGARLLGYGMASAAYPAHFQAAAARAVIGADGYVLVQCGTQDIGTGTYTVMAQLAAEVLGLPPERVRFELGDTRLPQGPASTGSSTAASVGSAVLLVARALRGKLVAMAVADAGSPLYGLAPERIGATDGRLHAIDAPSRGETIAALLGRSGQRQVEANVTAGPGAEQGQDKPPQPGQQSQADEKKAHHSYNIFGAHFCEVQVDALLGEVRVTRMVGAFAGGRVLNARTAQSQLMGGMVWGIGMALTEQSRIDNHHGCYTTASLSDYLVPVHADVPAVDVLIVEEDDRYVNPVGAKGLGEIGLVGAAAAIANAVYHATGIRVRDLPITPEKLIAAGLGRRSL
jgi:xanthine dehydrogenase YagR molybdenum-binding subunit